MALTSQGYLLTYAGEPYPPKPNRPPESSVTSFTKTVTTKSSLLVKCHATNHVSIHRKSTQKRRLFFSRQSSSITGTFAIDSFLHIPPELLPALSPSETTRRNLKLEVDNGGIDVDIYLVAEGCGPRATMYLGLCGGGHNTFPVNSHRPAFHLRAVGVDGQVSLQLPRSFHGMIVITVNAGNLQNHIMLSRELLNSATILTESSQVRGYFVGEMGDWSKEGDKVDVIVDSGRCNLAFEGEKCRSLF
ncbi:hypothetical protein C8J56DRAFT_767897 [Mycena floridula]|nr:hypothetical protein C8J56DRAFT_767897 [Mycena floridula]